jgi:hypothetical protein
MGASSVRRSGGQGAAGNIGALPIPDSRLWPAEIRAWFSKAVGEWGPLDIFVFDYGQVASCILHDAITVAAILPVDASEWHTEGGYPAFIFDSQRIGAIQHRLGCAGYNVHVLTPAEQQKQQPRKRKRAAVVSIAHARRQGEQA